MEELIHRLSGVWILFDQGAAAIEAAEQLHDVRRLSEILRQMDDLAHLSGAAVTIEVIGQTDALGQSGQNKRLSESRARAVLEAIHPTTFTALMFHTRGIGPTPEPPDSHHTGTLPQDRRVSFLATVQPSP